MRDLLVQELYRAWELLEESRPERLHDAPPLHRRHAAWAVLTVPAGAAEGRARGRMRALLTALEEAGAMDAHAWPRPITTGADTAAGRAGAVRYAIGLGAAPPDRTALTRLGDGWLRGLPDTSLTWADGGAVPTLG